MSETKRSAYVRREPTAYRSRVNTDQPIQRRILDALTYIVHTRKQQPKMIYLTEADLALLPKKNRMQMSIAGFEVRIGKESKFYTVGWWGRRI